MKMKTVKITMKSGETYLLNYKVAVLFASTTWVDFIAEHNAEEIIKIEEVA